MRAHLSLRSLTWFLILAAALAACDSGECLDGAFGGSCGAEPVDVVAEVAPEVVAVDVAPEAEFEPGEVPPDANPKQALALEYVNAVRHAVGLASVDELAVLNAAADAHADFYALHVKKYNETRLSPHEEDPSFGDGFTAVNFFDRMQHYGYSGWGGAEIIAFYHNPRLAVQGWVETLYHRIPIVDPASSTMGYGGAGGGTSAIDVIDFGIGGAPMPTVTEVLYPWEGQVEVPRSWDGFESPQPPPPPGGYPSGSIITATFVIPVPTIQQHQLLDPSGADVAHTWLTPQNDEHLAQSGNVFSLYADDPLQPLTSYRVVLSGTRGGQPWDLEWSFTTAAD